MDRLPGRHEPVEGAEEAKELPLGVPGLALTDDPAGRHLQGGE